MINFKLIDYKKILKLLGVIIIIWIVATSFFGKIVNTIVYILFGLYVLYLLWNSRKYYKALKKEVEKASWGKPISEMTKQEIKDMKILGGFKNGTSNNSERSKEGKG